MNMEATPAVESLLPRSILSHRAGQRVAQAVQEHRGDWVRDLASELPRPDALAVAGVAVDLWAHLASHPAASPDLRFLDDLAFDAGLELPDVFALVARLESRIAVDLPPLLVAAGRAGLDALRWSAAARADRQHLGAHGASLASRWAHAAAPVVCVPGTRTTAADLEAAVALVLGVAASDTEDVPVEVAGTLLEVLDSLASDGLDLPRAMAILDSLLSSELPGGFDHLLSRLLRDLPLGTPTVGAAGTAWRASRAAEAPLLGLAALWTAWPSSTAGGRLLRDAPLPSSPERGPLSATWPDLWTELVDRWELAAAEDLDAQWRSAVDACRAPDRARDLCELHAEELRAVAGEAAEGIADRSAPSVLLDLARWMVRLGYEAQARGGTVAERRRWLRSQEVLLLGPDPADPCFRKFARFEASLGHRVPAIARAADEAVATLSTLLRELSDAPRASGAGWAAREAELRRSASLLGRSHDATAWLAEDILEMEARFPSDEPAGTRLDPEGASARALAAARVLDWFGARTNTWEQRPLETTAAGALVRSLTSDADPATAVATAVLALDPDPIACRRRLETFRSELSVDLGGGAVVGRWVEASLRGSFEQLSPRRVEGLEGRPRFPSTPGARFAALHPQGPLDPRLTQIVDALLAGAAEAPEAARPALTAIAQTASEVLTDHRDLELFWAGTAPQLEQLLEALGPAGARGAFDAIEAVLVRQLPPTMALAVASLGRRQLASLAAARRLAQRRDDSRFLAPALLDVSRVPLTTGWIDLVGRIVASPVGEELSVGLQRAASLLVPGAAADPLEEEGLALWRAQLTAAQALQATGELRALVLTHSEPFFTPAHEEERSWRGVLVALLAIATSTPDTPLPADAVAARAGLCLTLPGATGPADERAALEAVAAAAGELALPGPLARAAATLLDQLGVLDAAAREIDGQRPFAGFEVSLTALPEVRALWVGERLASGAREGTDWVGRVTGRLPDLDGHRDACAQALAALGELPQHLDLTLQERAFGFFQRTRTLSLDPGEVAHVDALLSRALRSLALPELPVPPIPAATRSWLLGLEDPWRGPLLTAAVDRAGAAGAPVAPVEAHLTRELGLDRREAS